MASYAWPLGGARDFGPRRQMARAPWRSRLNFSGHGEMGRANESRESQDRCRHARGLVSSNRVRQLPSIFRGLELQRLLLWIITPFIQNETRGRDSERGSGDGVRQPMHVVTNANVAGTCG